MDGETVVQDLLDYQGDETDGETVVQDLLEHHGVLGMKWGHRGEHVHPDIAHIPRKTRKEAAKDAEEFTRAKLYFGQGAGTRRKLIKAKVESKKAKDPLYGKAFDHFVKQTDLGKRASQARSQRKRTDTKTFTKKTVKGAGHIVRGNPQYANTSAQIAVATGKFLLKNLKQSDDQEAMVQSTIDDILEHHGVKGMKWGRRKDTVGAQKVSISERGKKLKTSGGQGHPAHPDAIAARTSGQIAKKSGFKALSNKQLQDYNQRLNLEQQASRLRGQERPAAVKFIRGLLGRKDVQKGIASQAPTIRKRMAIGAAALALA